MCHIVSLMMVNIVLKSLIRMPRMLYIAERGKREALPQKSEKRRERKFLFCCPLSHPSLSHFSSGIFPIHLFCSFSKE